MILAAGEKRNGTHLEKSERGERVAQMRRDRPQRGVQCAAGPVRADLVGQRLVAVQAGDLLDQIDLGDEVVTPAGRYATHGRPCVLDVGDAADASQQKRDALRREVDAEHATETSRPEDERSWRRISGVQVDGRMLHAPSGERDHQLRDALERNGRE